MQRKYAGRLEITTRIGCNVNCIYCPQKRLVSRYVETAQGGPIIEMTLDTFKVCIDKLPQDTRIDFSGMAEPWLNPACTQMVQYVAEKGHPIAVYTTLVGMTQKDFNILCQIPMEEFVLHIPDDKNNSHIDITPAYIALLEQAIYATRDGSPIVTGYSCHAGIHPAIVEAIPEDGKLITELHDRAGNVGETEYVEHACPKGQVVCVNCGADINHNVLLPDGRVALCCMDYGLKHILGNLKHQTWEEIHESNEAKRVIAGLSDESADTLCRSCVNAKNIYDIYSEMVQYKDWVQNFLHQQKNDEKYLRDYKSWVENLRTQIDEQQVELKKYQIDAQTITDYLDEARTEINETQAQLNEVQALLTETKAQRDTARQELTAVRNSRAYKILTLYKKLRGSK